VVWRGTRLEQLVTKEDSTKASITWRCWPGGWRGILPPPLLLQKGKEMKSKDYRTTCDGVMVADVGFKKQLWALDPELDTVWDWGSNKWEIWRFPGQAKKKVKRIDNKAFHMLTVQTQGRTFRELGADILLKLQAGDPTRYTLKELCAYFDRTLCLL